ncbi:hypothetical protein NQZ68_026618, partial [Dissostichus eleginoides]
MKVLRHIGSGATKSNGIAGTENSALPSREELKISLEFTQDNFEEMRMGHKEIETKI